MRYVPRPFGGAIGPVRLITLIGLLCVVGMLMFRARDAATWRWLGREDKEEATDTAVEVNAPPPVATGPTDADKEEMEAAEEEFQALNDNSLELGKEEMAAYWRLLAWVERQPVALLQSRTKEMPPPRLNDLLLHPDKSRGKLLRLKLNVRRILEYKAPENPEKFKNIYELWGYTDESQSWLYVVVTPELPEGLRRLLPSKATADVRVTDKVAEAVWVYGYLIKVQGYADGKAEEKLRKAPLIAGRISWHAAPKAESKADLPPLVWISIAAVVAIASAGSVIGFMFFKGKRPKPLQKRAHDPQEVSAWLADAAQDEPISAAVVHLKPDRPAAGDDDPAAAN